MVADLTARRDSLLVSSLVDSLGAVALLVFFAGLAARLWQRDAVMLSFALASSGAVAVAVILGQAAIRVVVAGRLVLDSPEIARGLFVLQGVALHFDRFPLAVVIGASAAVFGNWLFRALCAFSVVLFILPTVAQVGALTPKGPVVTTTFALLLLWILFTIVLLLREVLTARRGRSPTPALDHRYPSQRADTASRRRNRLRGHAGWLAQLRTTWSSSFRGGIPFRYTWPRAFHRPIVPRRGFG